MDLSHMQDLANNNCHVTDLFNNCSLRNSIFHPMKHSAMQIPSGAWFPIALGTFILLVSYIWHYGASQRFAYSKARKMKLASLIRREGRE